MTVTEFIDQHFGTAKTIVIFGLGREGISSYTFLKAALPETRFVLVDDLPLEKLDPFWSQTIEENHHTEFMGSEIAAQIELGGAIVLQSPGIPLNHPLRQVLLTENTHVTSNTQVFFDLTTALWPQFKIVGITGTKGKSTTSSAIYHVLQTAEVPSWLGGNIGKPALDLVPTLTQSHEDHGYIVLELSSHQLDLMHTSPHIAVVQNIVPEHLDYYQNFDRYQAAKAHITQFQQSEDLVVFNPEYIASSKLAELSPGRKMTFSTQENIKNPTVSVFVKDQGIYISGSSEPVIKTEEIALKGQHNLENILPGVVIAKQLGLPQEAVAEALRTFRGLEHRLEHVATVNGIEYYNDSLATVPDATIAALEAFPDQEIILMAGGYDRGVGVTTLAKYLLEHPVKALVLFPTTGELLAQEIETLHQASQETLPLFPIYHVTKMPEAVKVATQEADENDVVLMSPAAASFNLFKDYQDRGNQFKEAVLNLPAA